MSTIRWFDHKKTYAKRLQADKLGYADANPGYHGWFDHKKTYANRF